MSSMNERVRRITLEEFSAAVPAGAAAFRQSFGDYVVPTAQLVFDYARRGVDFDAYILVIGGPRRDAYLAATAAARQAREDRRVKTVMEAMPKLRRFDQMYYKAQAALSAMLTVDVPADVTGDRAAMIDRYALAAAPSLCDLGRALLDVEADFIKETAHAVQEFFRVEDAGAPADGG